jgi:hypothetical protein
VIFLLKLLWKIVRLLVKLVLLPVRLLLRLVGVTSDSDGSAGGAAAAAAAASASAAAGAAANRREEEQTQQSTAPPRQVAPGTHQNYDRFRKAIYAYAAFGALTFLSIAIEFDVAGDLPLVPMALSIGLPLAVGYWTRTETKAAWGVGMAFAAVMLVLSLLGTAVGLSLGQQLDAAAGGGFTGILGLFGLLQAATLGAALYFGATGRAVALGGPAVAVSSEAAGAADADTDAPSDGAVASSAEPPETADTEPSPSAVDEDSATTAASASSGAAGSRESGTAAAEGTAADTTPDEGTAPEETVQPDGEVESEEPTPALELLAERAVSTADPAVVRELGDALATAEPDDGLPDEAVAALETCAEADDPDVRVAVCDACAAVEVDAVDEIVRRLRIDTNDRVAAAAMEVY